MAVLYPHADKKINICSSCLQYMRGTTSSMLEVVGGTEVLAVCALRIVMNLAH